MTIYARITTRPEGGLTDDSTLTIDGHTTPVPQRAEVGGRLAPLRIVEALATRGYRPATDYYADLGEQHDGYFDMAVTPIEP